MSSTGISFRTPASTQTRAWSSDGSSFFLMTTYGSTEVFDAATVTRLRTLAFQNEPTFSSADPTLLWGPDTTEHPTICTITVAGVKTVQLDLTDLVPSLLDGDRTYVGQLLTAADPERLAVIFGGTAQDLHHYCLVSDVSDLIGGKLLDTLAGTLDGVPLDPPLGFTLLHSQGFDLSGRYVLLYPVGQAPPIVVWDTNDDSFTTLTFGANAPGGHGALGFGQYVNQDSTGPYDGMQYQFRELATPTSGLTDLQVPLLSPVEIYLGGHPNWGNAQSGSAEPVCVGTYRSGPGLDQILYPWRAWDNEIVTLATDGSFVIARYAHHQSNLAIISPNWGIFWATPRPQVSPDGTKVLFTSNMNGTLGEDSAEPGTPRQDVFLVTLSAPVVGPLLTNLGVAGLDGSFAVVRCYTTSGAVLGTIDQRDAYDAPNLDGTGLGVCGPCDRLLFRSHRLVDDAQVVLVYNGFGARVAVVNPVDQDATVTRVSPALWVHPTDGTWWISVDRIADTQIWEYDPAGVFQRIVVAAVTITATAAPIGHGLWRQGTVAYFIAQADSLLYVLDLETPGDAVPFFAVPPAFGSVGAVAVAPDGTVACLASEADNTVSTYTPGGVLVTTVGPWDPPSIIGLAADRDSAHLWVGQRFAERADSLIWRVTLADGSMTSFSGGVVLGDDHYDATDGLAALLTTSPPPPPPPVTPQVIRMVRVWNLPFADNKWVTLHDLEIICQTGVGLTSGQGSDPILMLQISRDSGHTWGTELQIPMGKIGQYQVRARVNRLGRYRQGMARAVVTDPVVVGFLACNANYSVGTS